MDFFPLFVSLAEIYLISFDHISLVTLCPCRALSFSLSFRSSAN